MYLEKFSSALREKWKGSLFNVREAKKIDFRAKEYLHRLCKLGRVERVYWGWYCFPEEYKDVWDFLIKDKGFKVLIKQTAASIWNYDFVHRNIYKLAVENPSYKKALEDFGKSKGWIFEIEYHRKIPYEYRFVDGLFVEVPESCVVNCVAEWSFLDAIAILYFRKDEISLRKIRELGRWKRISRTNVRVWNTAKYACNLFNEKLNKKIFKVKKTRLHGDLRELIEEAVEKVLEFA